MFTMVCGFEYVTICFLRWIEAARQLVDFDKQTETTIVNKANVNNDSDYEQVLETEIKTIENEPYFRAVDRGRAEEILQSRVDGSCLVRPFKENHESIKFIVSVYSNGQYFHLFVRRRSDGQFTLGQPKKDEKGFSNPSQIVRFYRLHKLTCSNRLTSVRIVLVPIT